jgi:peroxiredoxin
VKRSSFFVPVASVFLATAAAHVTACDPAGGPVNAATSSSSSGGAGSGRATDFTGRDIDGKTVRLSDYLGKQAILIDFCATWCQPCLTELHHLTRIYEKQKAHGLTVLAVSMDSSDTIAEVPAWARRNQVTFPVILDEDSHIASIYNPKKSAPLTVLINKQGDIVYVHDGYNSGDEVQLEEHVAKVLDPAPATK